MYPYMYNIVNFALTWEKGLTYQNLKEHALLLISGINRKWNKVNKRFLKNYPMIFNPPDMRLLC